jgi:hypothetical protein
MSTNPQGSPRQLPEHPDLRHLKDQAKELKKTGRAPSLAAAQLQVARQYGFASWPKLKAHVESLQTIGQLKQAIDSGDLERVKELMTRNPELHRAPLGYGKNGPLTWVAECRVPREAPSETRLAMAKWMIEFDDIDMARWLIEKGADVNAKAALDADGFGGHTPLFHTVVTLAGSDDSAAGLLLDRGADPNARATLRKQLRDVGDPEMERMREFHNVTPIGCARQFQQPSWVNGPAIAAIAQRGGTAD